MDSEESLSEFFDKQIKDPDTAWSVGSFGAIAEFMRDPDYLELKFKSWRTAQTNSGGKRYGAHGA